MHAGESREGVRPMSFGTLTYARKLQHAGLSEELAVVHAEAMREALDAHQADLATKADLAQAEARIRADIGTLVTKAEMAQLETRLTRLVLLGAGVGGLVGGLIAAVTKLL